MKTVGNSVGIVLPKDIREKLRVSKGDTLHVLETPNGIELTPYNPEFARQMEAAERVMREDYGITTREQLDAVEHKFSSRVRKRFPEFGLLHEARDVMHERFADLLFPKLVTAPPIG